MHTHINNVGEQQRAGIQEKINMLCCTPTGEQRWSAAEQSTTDKIKQTEKCFGLVQQQTTENSQELLIEHKINSLYIWTTHEVSSSRGEQRGRSEDDGDEKCFTDQTKGKEYDLKILVGLKVSVNE